MQAEGDLSRCYNSFLHGVSNVLGKPSKQKYLLCYQQLFSMFVERLLDFRGSGVF